jgi:hypothetical protein
VPAQSSFEGLMRVLHKHRVPAPQQSIAVEGIGRRKGCLLLFPHASAARQAQDVLLAAVQRFHEAQVCILLHITCAMTTVKLSCLHCK